MGQQLNIRSDEAYALAHDLARRLDTTATEVVERALREYAAKHRARTLTPDQRAFVEDVMALAERSAAVKRPGATSDHSDLYDEKGLPR